MSHGCKIKNLKYIFTSTGKWGKKRFDIKNKLIILI